MEIKRVILVGKGGSGKDHAREELEEMGFRYCISHTTRPPRIGESEGKDYYYISKDAAAHHFIEKDLFYEYVIFNGWVYGTSREEFNKADLFIMTPSGISKIDPNDRSESFIIYFDIPIEIRRDRLSQRRDADDVNRRLDADEDDFRDFSDFDYVIMDHLFDIKSIWGEIKSENSLKIKEKHD
jgi:guanylate kinase